MVLLSLYAVKDNLCENDNKMITHVILFYHCSRIYFAVEEAFASMNAFFTRVTTLFR